MRDVPPNANRLGSSVRLCQPEGYQACYYRGCISVITLSVGHVTYWNICTLPSFFRQAPCKKNTMSPCWPQSLPIRDIRAAAALPEIFFCCLESLALAVLGSKVIIAEDLLIYMVHGWWLFNSLIVLLCQLLPLRSLVRRQIGICLLFYAVIHDQIRTRCCGATLFQLRAGVRMKFELVFFREKLFGVGGTGLFNGLSKNSRLRLSAATAGAVAVPACYFLFIKK